MKLITKWAIALAIGLSLLVPATSFAATLTTEQINAIVSLLESFNADASAVVKVKAVLTQSPLPGQGTPPGQIGKMACIALNRNLNVGSEGDDVRKLQDLLRMDPDSGFNASSTGYFGPLTAKAMMKFQMKNSIASSTTGTVGPLTRGFFMRSCGKGLDHMMPRHGTSTPTTTTQQ